MGTRVNGASDDLVEFDGDVCGEVGCYGTDERERGVLLVFSDGTVLEAKYGKAGLGLWGIRAIRRGDLLAGINECEAETPEGNSDMAVFADGLRWAFAAGEWSNVR